MRYLTKLLLALTLLIGLTGQPGTPPDVGIGGAGATGTGGGGAGGGQKSQTTGLIEITIRLSGEDKIGQPDPVFIAKLRNTSQETLVVPRKAVVFYLAPRTSDGNHIWQGCGDFLQDYVQKAADIELKPGEVVDVLWASARNGCHAEDDRKEAASVSWIGKRWEKVANHLASSGPLYGDSVVGVEATFRKKGAGETYRETGSKDLKLVMSGGLVFFWALIGGLCGWLINNFGQAAPKEGRKLLSIETLLSGFAKLVSAVSYALSSAVLTLVISEVQIPGIPVKAANDNLLGTFTTGFVFFFASEPVKKWLLSLREGTTPPGGGTSGQKKGG